MSVKKAVIPVAGFATRFLPACKSIPKCMLTIVDKPIIQYLVDEAVESGIEEILLIVGRKKEIIKDYFSEENKCLLSSDKNTLEDIQKLQTVFQKEKTKIQNELAFEIIFLNKNGLYSFIKDINMKLGKGSWIIYIINLILWIIFATFRNDTFIAIYGTAVTWLLLIFNIIANRTFEKESNKILKEEVERKTKIYIKGMGLNFVERIHI